MEVWLQQSIKVNKQRGNPLRIVMMSIIICTTQLEVAKPSVSLPSSHVQLSRVYLASTLDVMLVIKCTRLSLTLAGRAWE